jgi:hypothetical protein
MRIGNNDELSSESTLDKFKFRPVRAEDDIRSNWRMPQGLVPMRRGHPTVPPQSSDNSTHSNKSGRNINADQMYGSSLWRPNRQRAIPIADMEEDYMFSQVSASSAMRSRNAEKPFALYMAPRPKPGEETREYFYYTPTERPVLDVRLDAGAPQNARTADFNHGSVAFVSSAPHHRNAPTAEWGGAPTVDRHGPDFHHGTIDNAGFAPQHRELGRAAWGGAPTADRRLNAGPFVMEPTNTGEDHLRARPMPPARWDESDLWNMSTAVRPSSANIATHARSEYVAVKKESPRVAWAGVSRTSAASTYPADPPVERASRKTETDVSLMRFMRV